MRKKRGVGGGEKETKPVMVAHSYTLHILFRKIHKDKYSFNLEQYMDVIDAK
jgi:hypothetical protein